MSYSSPTSQNAYDILNQKAEIIHSENLSNGWAYIISGSIVLGFSIPATYLSSDPLAQAVYSISQTLGVAAVGYGSYLVLIDNEYTRFHHIITSLSDLSVHQKNHLSQAFLLENSDRARNVRKIRVITHGLTALLNFVSALTTSHVELQTALFFLGGINTLAALNFALTWSEEEKLYKSISPFQINLGQKLQVSFHF
jgi:hypothetical protein